MTDSPACIIAAFVMNSDIRKLFFNNLETNINHVFMQSTKYAWNSAYPFWQTLCWGMMHSAAFCLSQHEVMEVVQFFSTEEMHTTFQDSISYL